MKLNIAEMRQQLQGLELSDIGNWPNFAKTGAIIILCGVVLGLGFWFDTRGQMEELDGIKKKEQDLKTDFVAKQHKAANLTVYREQMVEMKKSFGTMLRQLPSKTEIAELLVDISQTGLSNGLEFELFKPEAEKPAEFYAELPIKIKVTGSYHELGNFVSGVAQLPRIVTLHDIIISPVAAKNAAKPDASGDNLMMELTAKTYRYLEEGTPCAGATRRRTACRAAVRRHSCASWCSLVLQRAAATTWAICAATSRPRRPSPAAGSSPYPKPLGARRRWRPSRSIRCAGWVRWRKKTVYGPSSRRPTVWYTG